MFASIARAIISRAGFLHHFAILTAVGIPALLCSGCVAFLDAELNNRGGVIDLKLDERWILADTKQMRVLRAYVSIGSLARMSRENYYNSERQLIAQHVNTAVNVAFDAIRGPATAFISTREWRSWKSPLFGSPSRFFPSTRMKA